jgi:hypothetical protein
MPVAGFFSSSSTPRTISVHLAQCIHSQLTPLSVSLVLFEFVNHAPCEGAISHSCTTNRDVTKIVGTMNKHPRGILYEDLSNRILVKMSTIQPIIEPMLTEYRKRAAPTPRLFCCADIRKVSKNPFPRLKRSQQKYRTPLSEITICMVTTTASKAHVDPSACLWSW